MKLNVFLEDFYDEILLEDANIESLIKDKFEKNIIYVSSGGKKFIHDGEKSSEDFLKHLSKNGWKNIDTIDPGEKGALSTSVPTFIIKKDNKTTKIAFNQKTKSLTSFQNTSLTELGLAIAYIALCKNNEFNDISNSKYLKVGDELISEQKFNKVVNDIISNEALYKNCINQAKLLKTKLGSKFKYIIKDEKDFIINKLAKKLASDDKISFAGVDKWNPSDIWILKDSKIKEDFNNLEELNNYLNNSIENNNGLIGISIKSSGSSSKKSPKLSLISNNKENNDDNFDFKELKIVGGINDSLVKKIKFYYNNNDYIEYRTFQDNYVCKLQGNSVVKGSSGFAGKINGAIPGFLVIYNNIAKTNIDKNEIFIYATKYIDKDKTIIEKKLLTDIINKSKNLNFDKGSLFIKDIKSITQFEKYLNEYDGDINTLNKIIAAQAQCIMIGLLVQNLNKKQHKILIEKLLKAGGGKIDENMPNYYKINLV